MQMKTVGRLAALTAATLGVALANPGAASAVTETGWTGPAYGNGIAYLHNSSITNAPYLYAETAIWTGLGSNMGIQDVGVNARLFKSGILCSATDYIYNGWSTPSFAVQTGDPDCGPGSYNSHGLARVRSGSGYNAVVTFPTNPVDFPAPAALSQEELALVEPSITPEGLSIGSAQAVESDADLPDLIAAYGTNNELGYVKKGDFVSPALSPDEVRGLPATTNSDGNPVHTSGPRTIPLVADDGTTVIGQFEIG